MRLVKYLAHAGVASRRGSERLIAQGVVIVDGTVTYDPAIDVTNANKVIVEGKQVKLESEHLVYALNKPTGVVSTASDTHNRPTVCDFIRSDLRLYPVGRLDVDTTGLILVTNDGELAHRLTHPRYHVSKTYRIKVRNPPVSERDIKRLAQGVRLDDGVTAPAKAKRLKPDLIELEIYEGKKRQVRRMCKAIGHSVIGLERIRFGPIKLGSLASGSYRQLSDAEVKRLYDATSI